MTDSILEKVKDVLVDYSSVDRSYMTLDASFMGDLIMDSLDVVSFIMALEETFEIEISDSEADPVKTVGEACELLEAKLAQARSAE